MSKLTTDILPIINSYLSYDEILRKCRTDTNFAKTCKNNYLWYVLLQRDFPYVKVSKNDTKLKEVYELQVKYKKARLRYYNFVKSKIVAENSIQPELVILFPVNASEYLNNIINNLDEYDSIDLIKVRTKDRYIYTFSSTILDKYYANDPKILQAAIEAALDIEPMFNQSHDYGIDYTLSMLPIYITPIIDNKIPYYKVDKEETTKILPLDILSAATFINRLIDKLRLEQLEKNAIRFELDQIIRRTLTKIKDSI